MFTEALQERLLKSGRIEVDIAGKAIELYGDNAEHNLPYFLNNGEEGTQNTIISLEHGIILANVEPNGVWNIFPSGIIAPQNKKVEYFEKFCDYCFNQHDANEVYAELTLDLYNEIKESTSYKISDIQFNYTWPVVDLKSFNENLEGSDYYELRKVRNSFLKSNSFEIKDVRDLPETEIKKILEEWQSNRKSPDNAHATEYKNWIKTNFSGCDYAKCWIVNSEPCAIIAGWKIPNSDSFYLAVVLHNYKIKSIGEMIYLQTLIELKKLGYKKCNLGGSDEKLLNFKKKFLPTEFYKTVEFSARRK